MQQRLQQEANQAKAPLLSFLGVGTEGARAAGTMV